MTCVRCRDEIVRRVIVSLAQEQGPNLIFMDDNTHPQQARGVSRQSCSLEHHDLHRMACTISGLTFD